jgi:hypothetical protein
MGQVTTSGRTASELLFGLRVAITTIAGAVLLTASLPRKLGAHHPLVPQLAAYSVLLGLLAVEVALLVRRREWGRLRAPALGLTLGESILSTWTLQPEYLTTSTDWSFGTTGWLGVILLYNRPITLLATFLAAHEAVTVVRVMALPHVDRDFVLNLVAGSVGTVGFPLACGLASAALRGIAALAERAQAETEAIRSAEAVSNARHAARQDRLALLDAAVEPLLQGLADGSLAPADPRVQRNCAVEAARLRRMLAETDVTDDPLLHELRHGADVAERQGILIEFDTVGTWAAPDVDIRRALIDGPLTVLAGARSRARVSVIGTADSLSVNVVADSAGPLPRSERTDVEYVVLSEDDTTWIEARWTGASQSS